MSIEVIIHDDLDASILSSPTDTQTGDSTANLQVVTDKDNGTLYWVVTQSASAPTAAQAQAGQDHTGAAADASGSQAVSTTGGQEISASGLTGSTGYFAHFCHVDVSVNESDVASGDGFTTDATADIIAPILSAATDAAAGATTADLGVTTDENDGTLYWVVTQSATQPSQAQVKAGQDHTGLAADDSGSNTIGSTGAKTDTASGLTAETAYYAHFMLEDAADNQSAVVSGDGFTTWPAIPADENLTSPGSGNWTVPSAADYYDLTVTVWGAGGGGGGGGISSGYLGTNGGGSSFNTSVVGGGGKGGQGRNLGGNGGNGGTGTGGDTNTSGEGGDDATGSGTSAKGGAGGDGAAEGGSGGSYRKVSIQGPGAGYSGSAPGGGGGGGVRNWSDGGGGGAGGGAAAVKTYAAGTLTVSASLPYEIGAGGIGGNGYQGTATKGGNGGAGKIALAFSGG